MRAAKDHRPTILKAAARLFGRKRFHEVLIDDVAASAGVAKGTIYRFYKTKEDLYADICLASLEGLNSRIDQLSHAPGTVQARLKQMVFGLTEHLSNHREFFQVVQQEWGQKRCAFLEQRQATVGIFARVIRAGQSDGLLRGTNAAAAADMLLGMVRSMVLFGDSRRSAEEMTDLILDVFLNGLDLGRGVRKSGGGARRSRE